MRALTTPAIDPAHRNPTGTRRPVLLVRPANLYGLQNYPPLGLILVGTALKEAGYDVEIMIFEEIPDFENELVRKAQDALFVGFTCTTAEIPAAIRLAQRLRDAHGRKVPLAWGGWHVTLFIDQMEKSDLVDFFVPYEGEHGATKIAHHLALRSAADGNGHPNPPPLGKQVRTDFLDMMSIPYPRYDLVSNIQEFLTRPLTDKFLEYYEGPLRWLPYESSRGCPFPCAFCINPVTDNREYRTKAPDVVADEIVRIVRQYDLTHVKIIDDLFFTDVSRVKEVFRHVEASGTRFTWDAECRVDLMRDGFIEDETMATLKRNGLVQLTFGIESGSEDSLRRMKKGGRASPKYAIEAVEACGRQGIASRGSFILDIPGDKPEDLYASVDLIRRLRRVPRFACGVHTFRPYPKSPLCQELLRAGRIHQPDTLEGWAEEECVRQYTDTSAVRRWQDNWDLSAKISFYESLESGFWVKPHQLRNDVARAVQRAFMSLARWRNERRFYGLEIDRAVYIPFRDFCIRNLTYGFNYVDA